jgi:hypothetical protein
MTTAPHMPAKAHSSDDVHHRPKGESRLRQHQTATKSNDGI